MTRARLLGVFVSAQRIECGRGTCLAAKLATAARRYYPLTGQLWRVCGKDWVEPGRKHFGITVTRLACKD